MDTQALCLGLVKAESQKDVISLLKEAGYWDDLRCWRLYGDNETNYSTIGTQQSDPEASLVEKLTNSIDAVLMRECRLRGIDPTDRANAPASIKEATERFFGVRDGLLTRVGKEVRTSLADNILLVATGSRKKPNYTVIDRGEGQSPSKFHDTLLSLTKSNKNRIHFVQGRFNMGSTGALNFCGEDGLELIVSRRHQGLAEHEPHDPYSKKWGFTVVRRFRPSGEMRISVYRYLAPNGQVLSFDADSLDVLPGKFPIAHEGRFEWGTLVKMYEYNIAGRYSGPVFFDLNYRLSMLLAQPALPVRVLERRPGYEGHSPETILSGLSVRLDEDPRDNLELLEPITSTIRVGGEEMRCRIYVFKENKSKNRYALTEGVIFLVGGQTHGTIPKTMFRRERVKLDYLANTLLVIADCSSFSSRAVEELFMNSRDRLYNVEFRNRIEESIMSVLSDNKVLRELNHRKQNEKRAKMIGDSKPLEDLIQRLIKLSPSAATLLVKGARVTQPYDTRRAGTQETYKGEFYPTHFHLKTSPNRSCPANQDFRMAFETDAANDYFDRDYHRGTLTLALDGTESEDRRLTLANGIANLTVKLPTSAVVGEVLHYKCLVTDPSRAEPFPGNSFEVLILEPVKKMPKASGERIKPPGEQGKMKRELPELRALPLPIPVTTEDWEEYGFDKFSVLHVTRGDDGNLEFHYNVDNVFYLTELKARPDSDRILIRETWKTAVVLVGLAFLDEQRKTGASEDERFCPDDIAKYTRAIGPLIVPLVNELGKLLLGKHEEED